MEQRTAKAVALYARVSTLDQNCEVQLEDLRRYGCEVGLMSDALFTVEELAERLKVPSSWIYQHTRCRKEDRLPHPKIGKYLRFEESAVRRWLERHRHEYESSRRVLQRYSWPCLQ